jgi:hypothetical protein
MAIWQISFALIPIDVAGHADILSEEIFAAHADDITKPPSSFSLPSDYSTQIARLLPPNKGWSSDMELWGDDKFDDFTIWSEEGNVESIGVRIDVRNIRNDFLEGLLKLADDWSCVWVERRYRKVCRMGLQEFRGYIRGHPYSRSLEDPIAWIPVLVEEVKRNEK